MRVRSYGCIRAFCVSAWQESESNIFEVSCSFQFALYIWECETHLWLSDKNSFKDFNVQHMGEAMQTNKHTCTYTHK